MQCTSMGILYNALQHYEHLIMQYSGLHTLYYAM
jgi:hypothetical protein